MGGLTAAALGTRQPRSSTAAVCLPRCPLHSCNPTSALCQLVSSWEVKKKARAGRRGHCEKEEKLALLPAESNAYL